MRRVTTGAPRVSIHSRRCARRAPWFAAHCIVCTTSHCCSLGRQLDPQLDLFSVAIPLLVKSPYVRLIAQDLPNR
eukprot:scaffold136140_cov36-Tisochrysis_lutea.AAC.1